MTKASGKSAAKSSSKGNTENKTSEQNLLTATRLQNYNALTDTSGTSENNLYVAPHRGSKSSAKTVSPPPSIEINYKDNNQLETLIDKEPLDGNSVIDDDMEDDHKTTGWQTFIHLVKGYIGPGCLSLPWAISQLGVPLGCLSLAVMSFWSSYNCWIVVKLKRYIERTQIIPPDTNNNINNSSTNAIETASETPSVGTTTATNLTYPEVGDWAYGQSFQSYVTACVCTQQLAICTVFLSFIGENILAVFQLLNIKVFATHVGVITLALPAILSLSFLPSLKTLAPVMAGGTILFILTLVSLGTVIGMEWQYRPDEGPHVQASTAPLAVCAILYSYEGICLVLPVESAMKEPQHFQRIFSISMVVVALILAAVSCFCVIAFGEVTNGSVTAFLLQKYSDDPKITDWLMTANTLVSLSVLMTYPLQLFPALELLGPWIARLWSNRYGAIDDNNNVDDLLEGFEPLPALPEHEVLEEFSVGSLPMEHKYEIDDGGHEVIDDNNDADEIVSRGALSSVTSMFPVMTMPGDSPQLRAGLVFLTYVIAVVVPNVQALISLAGALAGASTALLIPPVLELAWIRHMERDGSHNEHTIAMTSTNNSNNNNNGNNNNSNTISGQNDQDEEENNNNFSLNIRFFEDYVDWSRWWMASPFDPWGKWWKEKLKCYILLSLGLVFCGIGTFASMSDIIRIYLGK